MKSRKAVQAKGGQVEPAVVPPYLFNVWLCRPGAESVTVSVLAWDEMEAFIEYGDGLKTAAVKLKAGEPQNIVLNGLKPDTSYNYRLTYRRAGGEAVQDAMRSFHTQRKAGSSFHSSCRRTRTSITTPTCAFTSKRWPTC
jgi:hypothetical protein